MKKTATWMIPCVATALALGLAAPAAAQLSTTGDGIVRLFCSDQPGADHPRTMVMLQPVLPGSQGTIEITDLAAIYEPDTAGATGEKMVVRVRVRRADGSTVNLGKMTARRDEDGELEAEKQVPAVTVAPGDTIRWQFRFRNFGPLGSGSLGDCLVLFVLAGSIPD